MADTRCADVELQLDVDVMILEYALYQATKARLEAFECGDEDKNLEATRLVLIFDAFIHLFNQSHPDYEKSPQLLFNLKILEFLVLFSAVRSGDFSANHAQHLQKEAARNYEVRQRWLAARTSTHGDLCFRLERQVYSKWEQSVLNPDIDHDGSFWSLFHLLPRFMEISAEIASLLSGDPNEKWMDIAGEFLLQTSVDCLRSPIDIGIADDAFVVAPGLETCFAWGFVSYELVRPDIPQDQQELDVAINELFRRSSDRSNELLNEENPLWTKIRAKYLSEFMITDDASVQSQEWRLERLTQAYPLDEFHDKVVNYIENVWDHHCQCYGIPVLAEIEQGHVRSLEIEGQDFDNFMAKVGLRKD
ncbi:uncharacterized protein A1O9_00471, partial [Exophiala aquamarina CBS 119918]